MKKYETLLITSAYLAIIIIWSTTPLAIKWSTEDVGFLTGIVMRMFIGTSLAVVLVLLWYKKLPMHRQAIKVYFASSIGIYGAMMSVYWGAQFISSGLVSVIYGLSPLFTSLLAAYILVSENLTWGRISGVIFGFGGLIVIFIDQITIDSSAILGILAVLASVLLHALSAIWIKKININLPALVVTSGGLALSLPLFTITYLLFAQPMPEVIADRTVYSIVYLGIIGSVVGFVSYYYVLSKLATSTVALVTLITPVCALLLGKSFNHEVISPFIWYGTALVMSGLFLHQWGARIKKIITNI